MTGKREHKMTREQIERWVTETRAAQGLPPRITDPATLAAFAVLVVEAHREQRATDGRSASPRPGAHT